MQIPTKKPSKNSVKTEKRLKEIATTLEIFERYYKYGYRVKNEVFIQLIMNFPKYNTKKGRHIFTQLWLFRAFDNGLLEDLLFTLKKIEEKRL